MIHVVLEYVKSNSKYITVVVVILKLVFISLISYIVCSLQTFLIALIRSAAVRLKISGSDDNTMTV